MYFRIIDIYFSLKEKVFDFTLFGIADENDCHSFLTIYYYQGDWTIDFLWKRLVGGW